jgi:hypothetical protein
MGNVVEPFDGACHVEVPEVFNRKNTESLIYIYTLALGYIWLVEILVGCLSLSDWEFRKRWAQAALLSGAKFVEGVWIFFIFSCLDAADPVRNPALKLFVGGVVAYGVAFIYIGAYLSWNWGGGEIRTAACYMTSAGLRGRRLLRSSMLMLLFPVGIRWYCGRYDDPGRL